MALFVIEGIKWPIDEALAHLGATVEESDQRLREALRGEFEIMANATLRRETVDGQLVITAIKNPGTKGCPLQALLAAPDFLNPGYVLDYQVRLLEAQAKLDLDTLLALQPRILAALAAGRAEEQRMAATRGSLLQAIAVPGTSVPIGF